MPRPPIDLGPWLLELGLEKYAGVFARHDINADVLRDLTEDDVNRLGLPIGPRRKLLVALQALAASPPAPAVSTPAPTPPTHEAERRQLTVMFCDYVGSDTLANRIDPEELREIMRARRDSSADVVRRFDGHVAQYLGDGLMVYFGWPRAHEDDAERAVRTAIEIVEASRVLGAEQLVRIRIGIATGTVVVGDKSSGESTDESDLAIGETPNLASRLMSQAGPDEIVIGPTTRQLIGDAFEVADLGLCSIKGLGQPVRAWRVESVHWTEGRFEATHRGSALAPFVGREEELSLLRRLWRQAREGEGRVGLIGGEAGIGKSRLTQLVRSHVEAESATIIRYQCSAYHLNSPLYPIIEQLAVAAGFIDGDSPNEKLDKMERSLAGDAEQVARSAPFIADLLSLPTDRYGPMQLSPQRRKERALEALAEQVEALSRRRPVLMLCEDVHWIDPTSQEALDVLVPRLQSLPVLLIVTFRPEYVPRWTQQSHVTVLGVGKLSRRQTDELVQRLTAGSDLPREVRDHIISHADGVPLFVEEITKTALESADVHTLGSGQRRVAIPTSLRESLLARLDRLSPVKDIVQVGACIGREFSYGLLATVAGMDTDALDGVLLTLTQSGMVYRRGAPPDATYIFKHALVQDAAYDSLVRARRQQLHARIAHALGEGALVGSEIEPELLAHHYTESGNLTAAIPLWQQAGTLAVRRFALREALAHLQQGLALVDQLPASPERDALELSLRKPLGLVWTGLHGWAAPEIGVNGEAMLRLARNQDDPESLLLGLWAMWSNTITQGRVADSMQWARLFLSEGERLQSADLEIFGHTTVTITLYYLGDLVNARAQSERALELYDARQAPRWMRLTSLDPRTFLEVWSSQWTWMLGSPDEAVRVSDEKDERARALGNAFNLGFALTLGAYVFDYRVEPERLRERVAEADRLAREQSIPFLSNVQVPLAAGLALKHLGQLPEAIASLRHGIDNWNRIGGHIRVPYVKAALAEAIGLRGELDAALAMIDECLEQIDRPGWHERSHLADVLRVKGWILLQLGKTDLAEAALRAAIAWAREQQAKSWELRASTTLAEVLIARGQRNAARELLQPIYATFIEGFETADLAAARTLLESPALRLVRR